MSALSASAAYTRHRYPGEPLFVMASTDALTEFADQRLLSGEEADAPDARAAAVVVGDAPEAITYDNLNRAFRLVRAGAELIGMHRNPWWLTPDGSDPRLGGDRHRPRVRDRATGTHPGQAVADVLPAKRRPSWPPRSARRAAGGWLGTTSRWSVTTSGPTSSRASGSVCAASSSCPANTGWRTSRRPPGARRPPSGRDRRDPARPRPGPALTPVAPPAGTTSRGTLEAIPGAAHSPDHRALNQTEQPRCRPRRNRA